MSDNDLTAPPFYTDLSRAEQKQLVQELKAGPIVVMVTHNRIGGVLKCVQERASTYEFDHYRVFTLQPILNGSGDHACQISVAAGEDDLKILFKLPAEVKILRNLLKHLNITKVEFHHFIGHSDSIFQLIESLNVPYDVIIHDYSWFCPRITLTTGLHQYCGEPRVNECVRCVESYGYEIDEDISPVELRSRSQRFLTRAHRVIVPATDVKRRIERQLGVPTIVEPWERDKPLEANQTVQLSGKKRRICVVGAIGYSKGFEILLKIAILIKHFSLPLEFVVVGYTCDDQRLLDTGCVTITGPYKNENISEIIVQQRASVGFLPALWPETWSYSLTEMWAAGLPVIAFDIGTPAERIRANKGGLVLPLNTPVERILPFFMGQIVPTV